MYMMYALTRAEYWRVDNTNECMPSGKRPTTISANHARKRTIFAPIDIAKRIMYAGIARRKRKRADNLFASFSNSTLNVTGSDFGVPPNAGKESKR
jgi:hypothetical protein